MAIQELDVFVRPNSVPSSNVSHLIRVEIMEEEIHLGMDLVHIVRLLFMVVGRTTAHGMTNQ